MSSSWFTLDEWQKEGLMPTREAPQGIVSWPDCRVVLEEREEPTCDLCDAPFTLDDVQVHVRVNAHMPRTIRVHVECVDIVSRYAAILLG